MSVGLFRTGGMIVSFPPDWENLTRASVPSIDTAFAPFTPPTTTGAPVHSVTMTYSAPSLTVKKVFVSGVTAGALSHLRVS